MKSKPINIKTAVLFAVSFLGGMGVAFAQLDSNATTIAYWKLQGTNFDANSPSKIGISGAATNVTRSGTLSGQVPNLWLTGSAANTTFSSTVPPVSLFNTSFTNFSLGTNSWNCGANEYPNSNGVVYCDQNAYGAIFRSPSFTEEVIFKTSYTNDQTLGTIKQTLVWDYKTSAYAHIQLNESASTTSADIGSLLFWSYNGSSFPTLRITAAQNGGHRFDDGNWHYVAARYNATTLMMDLLVVNQDGSAIESQVSSGTTLNGGGGGGPFIIGNDENSATPFDGLISQVRFSTNSLALTNLLAYVNTNNLQNTTNLSANLVRWSMNSQSTVNGQPGIADSLGSNRGLETFNPSVPLTNDIPPATMLINGNNAGANSFYAASFAGQNNALFYPQDVFGDVFSFTNSFSIELFFKTLGNQSATGKMQLIADGSDTGKVFRYGIDLNEAGNGFVTFAVTNNGAYQTASLTNANYADGSWHYLLAQYNSAVNTISLTVANTNGAVATTTTTLTAGSSPLFSLNTGNPFIGRYNYNATDPQPRVFIGDIDEVQLSSGLVKPGYGQLGAVLDHFAISAILSPQTVGTAITGITLTAQDANNNTILNFTGSVTNSGTAGITGTSVAFTNGVLSNVSVTPTLAGTNLTFIVTAFGKAGTNIFTVSKAGSTVVVGSTNNPSGYLGRVVFTATVPTAATGSVKFLTNAVLFDTETLSGGLASSVATTSLPRRTNEITVQYAGDANYLGSTNDLAVGQIVTNHPPVAGDTTSSRVKGTTFIIAVNGLLTNVTDVDGDTITLDNVGSGTNGATIIYDTNYDATTIYYIPSTGANSNANDSFTYTVDDGYGGSATGNIAVDVYSAVGQAKVGSVSNGVARITFYGIPTYTYVVETETNLVGPWWSLYTNSAGSDGTLPFTDPNATNAIQFYRTRQP